MAKQSFVPRTIGGQNSWFQNFSNKLPTYAAKYSVTPAEMADVAAGAAAVDYWLKYEHIIDQFARKTTGFRAELMHGVAAGAQANTQPAFPAPGVAPTAVSPDVIGRATAVALHIKGHKDYTLSDGQDMGLEGAEMQQMPAEATAAITVKPGDGGRVHIDWKKGSMDALEIHKSSDGQVWSFLAIDTKPDYIDTSAMPAAGQSAIWYYKAIYRKNDEQAGQWSDVASIAVKG